MGNKPCNHVLASSFCNCDLYFGIFTIQGLNDFWTFTKCVAIFKTNKTSRQITLISNFVRIKLSCKPRLSTQTMRLDISNVYTFYLFTGLQFPLPTIAANFSHVPLVVLAFLVVVLYIFGFLWTLCTEKEGWQIWYYRSGFWLSKYVFQEKQVRNPCVYSRPGDRVWL